MKGESTKRLGLKGASRGKKEDDENEWLVTFSDLITLILAFFIMIVSVSTIDPMKFERVSRSLSGAVGVEREDEPVDLKSVFELISELIKEENLEDQVDVELRPTGVAVTFKGNVLFSSGESEIRQSGFHILARLSEAINSLPYEISVEGHTDDIPISSPIFPSNWELSTARASRVVRYLIDQGVPPVKLTASGYADTKPKAPNRDVTGASIPYNQAINRRVELIFKAS